MEDGTTLLGQTGVAVVVVLVVVLITAASVIGPRIRVPVPLLLLVIGAGLSVVPGFPQIRLDPALTLNGLLPPLLYAAAVRASLVDFRENRVGVLALAVGLVVFTTVGVGAALVQVVPAVGFAAALAIGAVVAPPDAVATTALGRSIGMPRRITSMLEAESLLNDATALVAQSVAIAAISAEVTAPRIGLELLVSVFGGLVLGIAAGFSISWLRGRITDPVLGTLVSFAVPYLAFTPAQLIGGSGVLSVVVAGLIIADYTPLTETAQSRITEAVNWRTVGFVLENAVFLLIGLQVPTLLNGVRAVGLGTVVAVCTVVFVAVIVTRFAWVFGAWVLTRLGSRRDRFTIPDAAVTGWAGMRGVVTLAAAFLLPPTSDDPRQNLTPALQLAAFVVVAGTLLLQGLTLGRLVRALGMRGPDRAEDALQAASLLDAAAKAANTRLDELLTGDEPDHVVTALRARVEARAKGAWEQLGRPNDELEPPTAVYRRLRRQMIGAERGVVLDARAAGSADNEVLRDALARIDQEESLLDAGADTRLDDRVDDLLAPARAGDRCEHLTMAPLVIQPNTPGECEDCIREGTTWVHLRTCLTCGHVGCCDSSERRHATRHFHDTEHPVMRSAELGEAWRWCYLDEQLG